MSHNKPETRSLIIKFKGKKEVYDRLIQVMVDAGVEVKIRKGRETVELTDLK